MILAEAVEGRDMLCILKSNIALQLWKLSIN